MTTEIMDLTKVLDENLYIYAEGLIQILLCRSNPGVRSKVRDIKCRAY
jgi:hypothetical protein